MITPGNPQDSTQSHAQPGYMPPTGQPGHGQQDNPQGYGPRGASDDQTWAMISYILALVASIIAPLVIYLVKMNESRFVTARLDDADPAVTLRVYSHVLREQAAGVGDVFAQAVNGHV